MTAMARLGSAFGGGLRVVLYHHLAEPGDPLVDPLRIETPPGLFESHMRRLARDYEPVDLECVLAGRLPHRPLLVTFDDGYRSVLDVALPVLRRLGIPSVFFISSAFLDPAALPLENLLCLLVDRIGLDAVERAVDAPAAGDFGALLVHVGLLPYERRTRLGASLAAQFDVDQAAERATSGMFLEQGDLAALAAFGCEVGNHTRSHLFCRTIGDAQCAERELVAHRRTLEALAGVRVRSFSYPYGYADDATPFVERVLAESGHEARFLVRSRPNPRGAGAAPFSRVSLHDRSAARLQRELELLPRLRASRDRLRSARAWL
jgi:peptidoglycan/xylan/chitin deacetylase (PgdA/CDA1 family)